MFSSENLQLEEHVDAFLSFLCSTPGLSEVMLHAKNLNLKSASKILALTQDAPIAELQNFR